MRRYLLTFLILFCGLDGASCGDPDQRGTEFFERQVRPILAVHCYECHSEAAQLREGGLLLDRASGWLEGGDTGKAVLPGDPAASLLMKAVTYKDPDLQMPPDEALTPQQVAVLRRWIAEGAPGPKTDIGNTKFSRLGDQDYLFEIAQQHWAFQPVHSKTPPAAADEKWNRSAIDRFVWHRLNTSKLTPSRQASDHILLRRLYFDITGLPPTLAEIAQFETAVRQNRPAAVTEVVERLLASPDFGPHVGRLWLDVARYADTDSSYRPDTRTPHYFPFAFTYRDYVVDAFNDDKPIDQFIKEQLAADLLGFEASSPQTAALGFLATGPYANRNPAESIDDWIDVTTRGLMGMTAACARCHNHKYEPIPTADYYALHGIFSSVRRVNEIDEKKLPRLQHYQQSESDVADYQTERAKIDAQITAAKGKKSGGNNRSVSQKIRETALAQLLVFHPGAPVHTMTVKETAAPVESFIAIRGDVRNRGERVPRRFLQILDPSLAPFPSDNSGRLALAQKIADTNNPLTARVFVNRIWGLLMGTHLVATPSDFGIQGARPTHPGLLDWLAADFMAHDWSTKHLVRTIVLSRTYQQSSAYRASAATSDPENRLLWRANRKHLTIEAIRDRMLDAAQQLDLRQGGRSEEFWGDDYCRRRSIYGFVNRFNLDPTLRAYDFPARMQTSANRGESIVAPQALFTMNSPFLIDQSVALTELSEFKAAVDDRGRIEALYSAILQRAPLPFEFTRMQRFVDQQTKLFQVPRKNSKVKTPWPLIAQALMMTSEFQYID